jgi:hypothetical protein
VHKISFPTSLYLPKSDSGQELRPFYIGDEICPEILERATLNVFSITLCTGLQTHWFLMLEWKLDGASGYLIFSICTSLNKLSN